MLTQEALRDLVSDGWKLGCGCLYLVLTRPLPDGTTTTTLITSATNRFVCKQYHGRVDG